MSSQQSPDLQLVHELITQLNWVRKNLLGDIKAHQELYQTAADRGDQTYVQAMGPLHINALAHFYAAEAVAQLCEQLIMHDRISVDDYNIAIICLEIVDTILARAMNDAE